MLTMSKYNTLEPKLASAVLLPTKQQDCQEMIDFSNLHVKSSMEIITTL